jgi:hypothetical protein
MILQIHVGSLQESPPNVPIGAAPHDVWPNLEFPPHVGLGRATYRLLFALLALVLLAAALYGCVMLFGLEPVVFGTMQTVLLVFAFFLVLYVLNRLKKIKYLKSPNK